LRATLEPGTYECAVELACPNTKPKNWCVEKAPDWRSFGFWSGRIFSPSFELKVVAGTLKRQKIVVHGEPHLEKGKDGNFRLVFKKEEFSTVEVETRNGFFVGREGIFPDGRSALQSGAATDKPDQDWVLDIPARVKWPKYRAAIFETVKPPAHFWQPYASDDGYKVLWEVSFKTNLLSKADSMLTSPH
jgi:hypothetical protein